MTWEVAVCRAPIHLSEVIFAHQNQDTRRGTGLAQPHRELRDIALDGGFRNDAAELSSAQGLGQADSTNANFARRAINWFEKWLLVLVLGSFIAGILVASISQPVINQVDTTINMFIDLYDYVAPVAIFLILSPALARMFATRKTGKFRASGHKLVRSTKGTGKSLGHHLRSGRISHSTFAPGRRFTGRWTRTSVDLGG